MLNLFHLILLYVMCSIMFKSLFLSPLWVYSFAAGYVNMSDVIRNLNVLKLVATIFKACVGYFFHQMIAPNYEKIFFISSKKHFPCWNCTQKVTLRLLFNLGR